jgi:C-terminal processing protease CtpA/Prc
VNADKVDLDNVKATAITMAAGINDPYELGNVIRYIYQSLNDFHGQFFYKDSSFRWSRHRVIPDAIMTEWKKGPIIKTMMLGKNIGYLRMPSMMGGSKADFDMKAQSFNDSLCSLLTKNIKGLVLDLRLNGGGAMFPMILGVEQLLPEGVVGSFMVKKKEDWILKDNNFLTDTMVLAGITPKCTVNARDMPVVVLIGMGTGSSGEFTLMTFKGRKNTLLLGNETAGYTTVNSGFDIDYNTSMNLSVGYGRDRQGNEYTETMKPDTIMNAPDLFNDIANDEKVKAAVKWLKVRKVQ